jgi:hypothetical protein
MATFATHEAQIKRNLGNRTDSDIASTILQTINDLQKRLAIAHQWKELETSTTYTMVVGTSNYTEATLGITGMRKPYYVSVADSSLNKEVKYYPRDKWLQEIHPSIPQATQELPFCYTRWGTTWKFWYVPDDTYTLTIDYYKWPTTIASTATTPDFLNIDHLLISGCTYYTAISLEEWDLAQVWERIFLSDLTNFGVADLTVFNFRSSLAKASTSGRAYSDSDLGNPFVKSIL